MLSGIDRTAKAVAQMADAPALDVMFETGGKAVINDQALTDRTASVFKAAFGDKAILLSAPGPASEDYSEFIIAGVPSVFFSIGGSDPVKITEAKAKGVPIPVNHSPFFAPVPEPTIRMGVEAMTLAVINVLPAR